MKTRQTQKEEKLDREIGEINKKMEALIDQEADALMAVVIAQNNLKKVRAEMDALEAKFFELTE